MVDDDDWKRSALRDVGVVAGLLSGMDHERLFDVIQATSTMRWGRKKPRSVPGVTPPPSPKLLGLCDGGGALMRKKDDRPEQRGSRRSPTSPFSFDGFCYAASPPSGFEASSLPPPLPTSRSKVEVSSAFPEMTKATGTIEATTSASGKKLRKKKTFAELQEEKSLLYKENMQLKIERNALRSKVEEERALNQKLKRIKVDSIVQPVMRMACDQREDSARTNHGHLVASINPPLHDIPQPIPCKVKNNVVKKEKNVFLFDLNMIPLE